MVKIKTICRSERECTRDTKLDIYKVQRNQNPTLHQFSKVNPPTKFFNFKKAREYQRALIASKMEKIFAQPFLGSLVGHSDFISTLATSPSNMTNFLSGSYDGELRFWDLSCRKTIFEINAHESQIKGLSFSKSGQWFLSSGSDQFINLYMINNCLEQKKASESIVPSNKFMSKKILGNVHHSYSDEAVFATSGEVVQIWNAERSIPVEEFQWGCESVLQVKFNPSEADILAATGIDRSVILYDIRGATPLKKIFLANKSQAISWNPVEPINFTVGNDDGNCYTFDMRKLEIAKNIHKDHIRAIMDVDYAPTGKEFVAGSYDKTVRVFPINEGKSREIYHGKRMQKVFAVRYSQDNQYIYSGSQDMNIRIWKVEASKPLGKINPRQQLKYNYNEKLKDKFKNNKELKKILQHRHLPKYIYNARKQKQESKVSRIKKLKNQELNNPIKFQKPKPERTQKIQAIQE